MTISMVTDIPNECDPDRIPVVCIDSVSNLSLGSGERLVAA